MIKQCFRRPNFGFAEPGKGAARTGNSVGNLSANGIVSGEDAAQVLGHNCSPLMVMLGGGCTSASLPAMSTFLFLVLMVRPHWTKVLSMSVTAVCDFQHHHRPERCQRDTSMSYS